MSFISLRDTSSRSAIKFLYSLFPWGQDDMFRDFIDVNLRGFIYALICLGACFSLTYSPVLVCLFVGTNY